LTQDVSCHESLHGHDVNGRRARLLERWENVDLDRVAGDVDRDP
jgi:hypothetical protein